MLVFAEVFEYFDDKAFHELSVGCLTWDLEDRGLREYARAPEDPGGGDKALTLIWSGLDGV